MGVPERASGTAKRLAGRSGRHRTLQRSYCRDLSSWLAALGVRAAPEAVTEAVAKLAGQAGRHVFIATSSTTGLRVG